MRILVVNAGSSSLKLRVLAPDNSVIATKDLPAVHGRIGDDIAAVIHGFGPVEAVVHRIVHGGSEFDGPALIGPGVLERIRALTDLAPLHQPKSLDALDRVSAVLPEVPAVACFDTAFHTSIPEAAATYAVPREWRTRWEVKRYGFHGLSHAYASRRAAEILGRNPAGFRVVTCHLGSGASLAAVQDGRSVDTTMGFTPLEGLVMATRSGNVDPGLVLWLEEHAGLSPGEVAEALEQRSGLLALCGTGDMREIISRIERGDRDAALALDVYVHRLRASIAAMAASMNGLDALVFTGGVGENAPLVRERTMEALSFLGIELDAEANLANGDREIGASHASVRALVIASREDLEMARQARDVLQRRG